MNAVDPKGLKILRAYHPAYPERTSPEDFAYAKAAGLCFDNITMTHDESVKWAFDEFASSDKERVAASYLVGVGQNQPQARAALSAHAVMTHFPPHGFQTITNYECSICASVRNPEIDRSFINSCRWTGTLIGRQPYVLAFYLQRHNAEDFGAPTEPDVDKFRDILDVIGASPPDETPTALHKKIRKISGTKMSVEEARHFLNALGYAGILQTQKHLGFIYKYVGHSVSRKSHNSDWAYPVDFWTGRDGVNIDALKYWFSAYPRIANWQPK